MTNGQLSPGDAIERYLLLVDISGYTRFLAGVEQAHGEDFSGGLPAGYRVLGELIQGVIDGLPPDWDLVKVEGDAVFASAPADRLDGHGTEVVERLGAAYRAFARLRDRLAVTASDDKCNECFAVASLDLKAVVHRGIAVRQPIGGAADLVGPAVNVAHRLLKNTVRARIGIRPYVLLSQSAASNLGQAEAGIIHLETYPDVGPIDVRIIDLAEVAGIESPSPVIAAAALAGWPEIRIAQS
jgi:class 3 adenylate cyclase